MHKTKQTCSLSASQLKLIELEEESVKLSVLVYVFVFGYDCFMFTTMCGCEFLIGLRGRGTSSDQWISRLLLLQSA